MFHRQSHRSREERFSRAPRNPEEAFSAGPRGHRHHGGGHSRIGRFFAHGDLRLVILQLIAEKPRYGYEIIKAIEEQAAGAYTPSPGVVYPTLTLLEELGYVSVGTDAVGKKQHAITPEGTAFLEANKTTVDALRARMSEASRVHGGGPAPQIMRAMENLKLALRLRLSRGPLEAAQIDAVAAALDAAARQVEGA